MIYTYAMQESVIHHIAAANSLNVPPVYHQFIYGHALMVGEITSQNVYLIPNFEHNQFV